MKKKDWPVIICDVDGVLADMVPPTLIELYRLFGVLASPEDITQYNIGKALAGLFPLEPDELNKFLFRLWATTDIYERALPYFDIMQATRAFHRAGGDLRIATSRPQDGERTFEWLSFWFPELDPFRFVQNCQDKARVVLNALCEKGAANHEVWFVDDCHATCLQVHNEIAAASANVKLIDRLTIYMPERPWNRHLYKKPIVRRYLTQDIAELLGEE